MKKTAKYLVYMLTVVLIASVIGVAFAWYSSNTTVTATSSATAAKAENVDISFIFQEGDNETDKIYLSTAQLIADYYNRDKYSGEEGWSAALGGMVGCTTQEKDGSVYLKDPNVSANQEFELAEYLGTHDHVFTLYYYIEVKSEGKEVDFGLDLNSVKIYKNGLTLRYAEGDEVENSHVEYPVLIGEEGNEQPAGDGTIAKVTIGSETGNTVCYFDVTQQTVYGTLGEDGTLSDAITGASYNVNNCTLKLTEDGPEYVLSGHYKHYKDNGTEETRYFKTDAEEGTKEGSAVENFVFNCYRVEEKPENGVIFNKAHEGDYNLYTKDGTGADVEFAKAGQAVKTQADGDGYVAKLVIAITYFRKIEIGEDNKPIGVSEIFPYASKDYMKAHFKFNISAELGK